MKIAFIYQYYQTSDEPGHSIIYDLTQHLVACGHEVHVVAGEVGYMKRGEISSRPWYSRLIRKENIGGVHVYRTYTYSGIHRSYLSRFLSFLSFSLSCLLGFWSLPKVDVAVGSSPPIFAAFVFLLYARLTCTPYVFEVRDLWPDSPIQMGLLRSKLPIWGLRWMENFLYKKAAHIIAMTRGIETNLIERGIPADKVSFISCGVDPVVFKPCPVSRAEARARYGWRDDEMIVLYFGALGQANNLPVILRAAEKLRENKQIRIVLAGDGMMRPFAEREVERLSLSNVSLLPAQPRTVAPSIINGSDICLVTLLDIPLFAGAIPTKLVEYIACGKIVLAGLRGEGAAIAEESGCGIAFPPDDADALASGILRVCSNFLDLAARASTQGPAYTATHFLIEEKRRAFERVIERASVSR